MLFRPMSSADSKRRVAGGCGAFLVLCFLSLAALSAQAQLSVPLTIQEALYTGAPTTGINRSQDPVTVGIPLPDSAGITSTSQLGLSGAQVGQFRVLGRWPSGHIKWVLVDTQADVTAGGQNNSIRLTNGAGNFGGADLATDNGSSVTVNTGPAQFTIRKANFDLFDQVVVNGKTLVRPGTSPGLVLMGPAPGNTSCGACTNPYSSSNDPSSTAIIEENGPARAVVKVDGSHVDASGNVYMHYTVRMYFYRGKTYAKVQVILRNADQTSGTAGDFNSAFKGFASYEARVTPALTSGRTFNIGTPDSTVSGSFSGAESAYLYQAYSDDMQVLDWNSTNCGANGNTRCVVSYISRTPDSNGGFTYSQDGYQIVHGASLLASGDHTQYPQGWADLKDSTGAGMEIGVYQLSAYWPKSLQFVNGGAEARVGIWPDQGLFTGGGGQPYYQAWPAYSIHDLYFNFHDTAPASPATDFLAFQHYLVARAPIAQYNTAGVFSYPLLDPAAEDNYYRSIPVDCCLSDVSPKIFRFYDWPGGGAGNQHELRWSYLRNFLERGFTGRYLFAAQFYRMVVEQSLPRSDGFDWRDQPIDELNYIGLPDAVTSANGNMATRNWADSEHAHWYGITDYYFMTGDETVKDQILDGIEDDFLNPNTKANSGRLPDTRDIGVRLTGMARLYQFFSSINDPSLGSLGTIIDTILGTQVFPELNVSGYGSADQGISRARGVHWGCCDNETFGSLSGREVGPFREALLEQGLWELGQVRGTTWPSYNEVNDLAMGIAQWAMQEDYGSPPGQVPTAMNSGFIYAIFIDDANSSSEFYQAPGDGQTNWFHFYYPAFYSGDLSWRHKFEWFMQRINANFGLSIWSEYGSHLIQLVVNEILHPPSLQLVNVPLHVTSNGGGSYTLSWTVPQGAVSYRIKDYPGKRIVDWIGFNAGTNTFIGDPNTTWPWFASTEVTGVPLPSAGGSTQTFTVTGLDPAQTFNFALKAYVPASGQSGDTTPPTVSIVSPASGATVSGTITISASASDNVAVADVLFEVDGRAVGQPVLSPPYAIPLNTTQFGNGSHTLTAVATDSAGNSAQASVVVTFNNSGGGTGDTVPPTVSIIAPTAGATVSGSITVAANASDNVGVASVTFQVDGRTIGSPLTTSPYSTVLDTTQFANGPHTLTATASDAAGNTAQASVQVTVNNTSSGGGGGGGGGGGQGAVLSFTSPASGATVSGTVTISVTASQAVASVQVQIDGVNFGVPMLSPPYSLAWDTTHISNGPHTISAIAGASTASVTVDVMNVSSNLGAVATAGIDSATQFVIDLQDIWSLQACNGCAFKSADDLLAGQNTQVVLRAGSNPPVADQLILRQGTLNGVAGSVQGSQFTLQLASGSVGPASVLVVNNARTQLLNLASGVQPGQNIAVRGLLFKSGPQGTPTLLANEVAQGMAIPGTSGGSNSPSVSITFPAGGATVSGTVTVTASASDTAAISSVQFQVDGQTIGSAASQPYAVSFNSAQVGNGFHTLTALVTDVAGNSAQASITINVNNAGTADTIPPVVSITSPSAGASISGTVTLSANATDDGQVASVVFQADGRQLGTPVTAPPYAVQLNTTQLSNSTHTLSAVATDLAGNSAQASVQVTVSNTTPGSVSLSPATLSFGTQTVGATGSPQLVVLSNGTSSALGITGISATGDFAQTNNCGATLAAAASCSIAVTFTPTAAGTRTGTLTVNDNGAGSPQTAQLTGTGASATGSTCGPGQWCEILPNGGVSRPADEGWNLLVFGHDTGKFYLYANSGLSPTVNPWENAFLSYTVQAQPASSNPWVKLSDCGDTSLTITRQHKLTLATAIAATDTQLTFNIGGGTLDSPSFPQSGTVWLDDEAINFNGCTSQGGSGTCQPGATNLTLSNLVRGARQAAGYTGPGAHASGAEGNLACPAPTLNGSPSTDHPPSRHPYGTTAYDSHRGRIWESWGTQETWQMQDMWYLCVFQTAACSASQINAGWQRLPLYTSGGTNPIDFAENAMVYDPDDDVLVEFGGTNSGATGATYLFCLSAGAGHAYGCTDPGNLNKWVLVAPHDGTPVPDDAVHMVYDTVHHVVLTYGGQSGTSPLHIVQQYHPATGDWCLSDTSQGGSNAASCSLPAVSGPTPPSLRFAPWTFDNLRGKAVLYAGPGAVYIYDPAQNQWTLVAVPGGPTLPDAMNSCSWAYDDVSDTFVFVNGAGSSGFENWELPGSALGH